MSPSQHLSGKVALVTGGGNGIGRGVALTFAAQGAAVLVNDYGGPTSELGEGSRSAADDVVAEITASGGRAAANYGNVASFDDGEAMVQQAIDTFGDLDIVVCCAGILRERMVFNMPQIDWDEVIAVHLTGHFNVTRFASAWFRQQRKGRLIFFSSGAMFGSAGQPNYAAAKGGIYSFARSCANALQKYGVTVNVILPSASTRLMDRTLNAQQQTSELDFLPSERNRGTRRDPTNVAPWLVFLASDAGHEFNGQAFGVRGHEVAIYTHPVEKFVLESEGDQPWDIDRLFARAQAEMLPQLEQTQWAPSKWSYDVWQDEDAVLKQAE